jgi:hypothetical protein
MTTDEIKRAIENFNQDPTNLDAQKELALKFGSRRCLLVNVDGIDTERTIALWTFCEQTGSNGRRDGKTAAELVAEAVQRLPASPYSGEPLFGGKTSDGVDYSKVPLKKQRLIAFAALGATGYELGDEEDTLDAVMASPMPRKWQHIADQLTALDSDESESAQIMKLKIKQRLWWSKAVASPVLLAAVPFSNTPIVASNNAEVRKHLHAKLRTDSDLMAFLIDFFKDVASRVGSGMDRNQKETLLLQLHSVDEIVAALRMV